MNSGHRKAVVVVGHGSRVEASNTAFEGWVERWSDASPDLEVLHGYVELAKPSLDEALDRAATVADHVAVLPFFLLSAGHVKNDLPLAVSGARTRNPSVQFHIGRALGVRSEMVAVLRASAQAALPEGAKTEETAYVLLGRGSSDPDANGDLYKLASLMVAGQKPAALQVAFVGVAQPSLPQTLELLARVRPKGVVVVPHILFRGRLIQQMQALLDEFAARHTWISWHMGAPLGELDEAGALLPALWRDVEDNVPLPCDTCQYRTPVGAIKSQVGGLEALLYSVRHQFTHTQAMPHEHAHAPVRKHVLVCGNVDCAKRGSINLLSQLRRAIKSRGRERELMVTKTACMGRCGEGPTVAVYPDGVWYREFPADRAEQLVDDHLLGDELLAQWVDDIMSSR